MDLSKGYGITSNEAAKDKSIKSELGLLIIINSLCASKGYCWATNEHLAEDFDVTAETISRKISKLIKKGYLFADYNTQTNERFLRMNPKEGVDENVKGGLTKTSRGVDENVNSNIIIKNSISIKDTTDHIDFDKLLDLIKEKTGRPFRLINKNDRSKFKARLREGYTKKDIMTAIHNAALNEHHINSNFQWLTPEFFTRQKTLETYGSQKIKKTEKEIRKEGGHINY